MPVRRFRSVEEMERLFWREPGDPSLYLAIAGVWEFGLRTRLFPPGVYRHRTIEELQEQSTRYQLSICCLINFCDSVGRFWTASSLAFKVSRSTRA